MLSRACAGCGTPLGGTDAACPTCATPVPRARAATGRRVLIDDAPPAGPPPSAPRPSRPLPSAAPLPAGRAHGGPTVAGTVRGPVALDHRTVAAAGRTPLLRLAVVAVVVALLVAVVVQGSLLVAGPAPALVPLALVLAGLSLADHRLGDRTVEVRTFEVVAVTGATTRCELVGELVGGELGRGDVVEVEGRRARDGTVRVRAVTVPATGARVSGRRGLAAGVVRAAGPVAVGAVAVAVAAVVLLVGRG